MKLPDYIEALVFDAFGTLFDVKSLDRRLESHFGVHATAINQIWRQKQLQYTWLRSLMDKYKSFSEVTAEALSFACLQLGIKLEPEVKAHMVEGYYQLEAFKELKEGLGGLASRYKLAVLSNADEAMLMTAAKSNNIDHFFEAIISVDPIKKYKPIPEVYNLASKALHLPANKIAFVSSNTWDVAGAKSFGLYTIWLNRRSSTMEVLGYTPDVEIDSLSALI